MSNKKVQQEVRKEIAKLVPILTNEITNSIIEQLSVEDKIKNKPINKKIPKTLVFSSEQLNSMRFNEVKEVADKLNLNVINETKPDYVNAITEYYRNTVFPPKNNDNLKNISRRVSEKIKSRLVTYDEDIGYYTSTYNKTKYVYDIKTNSIVGKIVKGNKCVPLSPNDAKYLRSKNFNLYHVNELKRGVANVLSKQEIQKVLTGKNLRVSYTSPELLIDDDDDFYDDCDYVEEIYDDDYEDGDDIILDGEYDYDIIDDTDIEVDEVFNRTVRVSDSDLLNYRNAKNKNPKASDKRLSDLTGINLGKVKYISQNYGQLMNKYKRRNKNPRY